MSDELQVVGGTGGVTAQLEHLDDAVLRLGSSAAALADAAVDLGLGRSLLDGLAGLTGDPVGVLELEGDVVSAVRGLFDGSEAEAGLAGAVAAAVGAYRGAEEAVDGLWLVTRLGVALDVAPSGALLLAAAGGALPAVDALLRGRGSGGAAGTSTTAPDPAGPLGGGAVAGPLGPGQLADALRVPPALGGMTARQMTDAVVAGTPEPAPTGPADPLAGSGAVGGPAVGGPSVGVRLADPGLLLAAVLGTVVGGVGAVASGRSPSPRIARGLVEVETLSGTADATRVTTARVPVPAAVAGAGPPSGTAALVGRVKEVSDTGPRGRVRVEVVTAADGRRSAVVYMPGVQDWLGDSRNPISRDAALRAEAGMSSAYTDLVVQALEEAGVTRDEPVMLAGHSLGGLAAAQIAGDPAVVDRFTITTVLTAGSPIGAGDVPPGVTVLAMENSGDPVAALDLAANPDAPNVTTVVAPTSVGFSQHSSGPYVELAERVDASDEPSLRAWRQHVTPFLASPGATSVVTEVAGRAVDPTPHA